MQLQEKETIYITSTEGLRSAIREVMGEFNLIKPAIEASVSRPPATRKEGSQFLGISLPIFDTLLQTNQIKSFRIGRQVRINWSELENYINSKGE